MKYNINDLLMTKLSITNNAATSTTKTVAAGCCRWIDKF